ncbi:MAG: TolC family protein [Deltaproteobacteria bacterium]
MRRILCVAGLCLPAVGCLSGATNQSIDRALTDSSVRLRERPDEPAALPDLTGPISRETIVALAVSRSPGLAAIAHRARAMVYAARAEGSLPSPELGLEAWNLPLARPYAVGEANMYMVELRQRFPAAGSLDARARAMADEAHAMVAELASEERQIAQRAADAYADYVHGVLDHALHHDHLALLEQMQGAVRARFTTGGSGLADAARIDLEIAKTRRAIARIDGDIARARAALNALLRRPADTSLGTPSDITPMTVRLSVDELVTRAREHRGTFVAARDRIQAAQARREAAEAEARWPEFMVGIGYWQDPNMRPGYGANVSMSLPWLWGGQRHRVDEAREREASETSALAGASVEAQSEITEARVRLVTAEHELQVLQTQALPAARRSIDAIRAVYSTGNASLLEWIDAGRSFLDLEMEETDVSAELARAVASLERAVGTTLPLTAVATEDAR